MKFVFLPEAEDDIERLFNFLLNQGNALAAQKAMLAIDEGIQMLLESPYIGIRMEGRPGYRQLSFLLEKARMSCVTVSMKSLIRLLSCASGMDRRTASDL